jgi:hypothetical protein
MIKARKQQSHLRSKQKQKYEPLKTNFLKNMIFNLISFSSNLPHQQIKQRSAPTLLYNIRYLNFS